ncbi:unnamed protein product [Rotaria sordida]|uniref:Uncharacterized protein n=1 Tax=Rotaria sordida TaxID=392033 RepID=A0A815DD23_9BILA|nr:unnamed protein product [Rotaria sordida]CAF1570777.1 unnamed protein product [Rotaria sordida]
MQDLIDAYINKLRFVWKTEVISNGNNIKQSFEEWSVPVPLKPNLINSTYLCLVDLNNIRRRPLQHKPDVTLALTDVIMYLLIPGSILTLSVIVPVILFINQWFKMILKPHP